MYQYLSAELSYLVGKSYTYVMIKNEKTILCYLKLVSAILH